MNYTCSSGGNAPPNVWIKTNSELVESGEIDVI